MDDDEDRPLPAKVKRLATVPEAAARWEHLRRRLHDTDLEELSPEEDVELWRATAFLLQDLRRRFQAAAKGEGETYCFEARLLEFVERGIIDASGRWRPHAFDPEKRPKTEKRHGPNSHSPLRRQSVRYAAAYFRLVDEDCLFDDNNPDGTLAAIYELSPGTPSTWKKHGRDAYYARFKSIVLAVVASSDEEQRRLRKEAALKFMRDNARLYKRGRT